MAKRVLIVDDSKTAQLRLRKMLERFDVEIDISSSAEEALGYLSYRQPSVIFLDHHMEGMSGLSALKIIKSNPATALIPVVMYTSEQGDVYVGQARALGALDIISKEVIQHASIEKVLSSLGITSINTSVVGAPSGHTDDADSKRSALDRNLDAGHKMAHDEPQTTTPYVVSSDLHKVQAQVGKLFEIHIAKVRQEIEDSTKFLMRRLSKEIQERGGPKVGAGVRAAKVEDAAAPLDEPVMAKQETLGSSLMFPALVFLALVFVGYQLFATHQAQELNNEQYDVLSKQSDKQNALVTRVLEQLASERQVPKGGVDARVMLDALSWAVNVNPQVPFGEKALDDQRIYLLGELLSLLKAANFAGTIFIDVHAGNYCVIKNSSGEWMLPEPESNLDDCVFLADQEREVVLDDQVSVGFLNYLHSTPVLTEGGIAVELSSMGYSSPKFSYPPTTSAVSAGDWNVAAAQNSRLSFSFAPE